jgi:hypothetical protein
MATNIEHVEMAVGTVTACADDVNQVGFVGHVDFVRTRASPALLL